MASVPVLLLIDFDSSLQAVVRVYSPSVKTRGGRGKQQLDPVFADGDFVSGTVTLDHTCSQSGRLTMTVCLRGRVSRRYGTNVSRSRSRAHSFAIRLETS